jgi:thiol-disulfide isomerase/thioredoxin
MSGVDNPGESQGEKRVPLGRLGFYTVLALCGAGAGALTAGLISRGAGPVWERDFTPAAAGSGSVAGGGIGGLQRTSQPRPLPDLAFVSADGSRHRLSEWRGKVVLLNLWATWCAPCKAEMPSLDRLQAKFGGDRFTVLAISTDKSGSQQPASFFAKEAIVHLDLYNDATGAATSLLGAAGLPLSIILDGQGREVARLLGPARWDSPEAATRIEEFLNISGNSG